MPEAIVAFLDADTYEDALRNAVSPGGDSDTLACITGGIAEAFYGGVPLPIEERAKTQLPSDLLDIVKAFYRQYPQQA